MAASNIPKIDEHDVVIGVTTIKEAKESGWARRISRVFIFDGQGSMLLQKRSMEMHCYPGLWDQAVGGHVDVEESYKQAALREMGEELGITDVPLHELSISYKNRNCFEGIYKAVIPQSAKINFDTHEVEAVRWITIENFEKELTENPERFVPPFAEVWKNFKDELLQ